MPAGGDSFSRFLNEYSYTKGQREAKTHTRIPSALRSGDGGSFCIPPSRETDLLHKHYKATKKGKIHLTEVQQDDGPILVDLDFHYDSEVSKRQHNKQDIEKIITTYTDAIWKYTTPESVVETFVMQKEEVNRLETKTKDGIHIIFGVNVKRPIQLAIRQHVVRELESSQALKHLPLTNSWSDIVDVAITRGTTNWQVYGSCKPGHASYEVVLHYRCFLSPREGEGFTAPKLENNRSQFNDGKYLTKLSARYGVGDNCEGWPSGETREEYKHLLVKRSGSNKEVPVGSDVTLCEIKSEEELDRAIEYHIFASSDTLSYRIPETHQFALALPKSYHGPGSYDKWMRLGWALANTGPMMFVTWLKVSCKEPCRATLSGAKGRFDWSNVQELWDIWTGFQFSSANGDGLSYRSIMYWCKQDAPQRYQDIKKTTIDYFIDETLDPGKQVKLQFAANNIEQSQEGKKRKVMHTEFDVAQVLYQLYKEKYVCASIKNNVWYEYRDHRWHEIDSGSTLRMAISKSLYKEYFSRVLDLMQRQTQLHDDEDEDEDSPELRYVKWRILRLTEILPTLKQTNWKNNIMREAKEIFYNKDFYNELDQNPYLLCFKNGIIDFKEKVFRDGRAEDYVSFCTNVEYIPKGNERRVERVEEEVKTFMEQLFPATELRRYMWEHLASTLIGTLDNQTFNMYFGSGRNGKSVLVDLMSKVLGDYKGTVPTSLITQSRPTIGSTSSEIAQLRGVRYAVMQEPSKGDKINEGIMKEITGGDPIQGRALFKDTVTFVPQFKLVVCTNTLFEISSNDDGTWRRIRICDFLSKFVQKPYEDPLFPKQRCPHQFPLDKKLDQKFADWAPVLAYLLVDLAFDTEGDVRDCDAVLSASNRYRDDQDKIAQFARERIIPAGDTNSKLYRADVKNDYKGWCDEQGMQPGKEAPKINEIIKYLEVLYGRPCAKPKMHWLGLQIRPAEKDVGCEIEEE